MKVYFMCHHSWALVPRHVVNPSDCVSEGVYWMRVTFTLVDAE